MLRCLNINIPLLTNVAIYKKKSLMLVVFFLQTLATFEACAKYYVFLCGTHV